MTQNQTKVLVALALACLVGTGLWMQHRRWDRLRQQQTDTAESLTAANAELVTLRTALENASNQLAQVAAVPDEMLRLRGEVARLRRDGGPQIQEGQSVSKKPIDNHQDQLVAANVVRSTIPLGRSVLTGGWMAPSGKRVLVVVQPTVVRLPSLSPERSMQETFVSLRSNSKLCVSPKRVRVSGSMTV